MGIDAWEIVLLSSPRYHPTTARKIGRYTGMYCRRADKRVSTVDRGGRIFRVFRPANHKAPVVDFLRSNEVGFEDFNVFAAGRANEGKRAIFKWTTALAVQSTVCR
jgi:hypothetical protein